MNLESKDSASVRFPPPLIFLTTMVLGYAMEYFSGLWPSGLSEAGRTGLATVCTLPGLLILFLSLLHFRRTGQRPEPWTSTPEIINEGVYRYSRNPMYLGMSLVQFGVGVSLASGWIIVLLPCAMLAVYRTAIVPEEKYLENKFGREYLHYKAKVRRWI